MICYKHGLNAPIIFQDLPIYLGVTGLDKEPDFVEKYRNLELVMIAILRGIKLGSR